LDGLSSGRTAWSSSIEVVAQAADAGDLLRKARAHTPDVVVTDVQMPPEYTDDGLRAAVQIRHELPDTGVLVLSQFSRRVTHIRGSRGRPG
jgi:DNA-binding NarL/FixJ family response regulator